MLSQKQITYLDSAAFELLEFMERFEKEKHETYKPQGSLSQQIPIDLGKIIGNLTFEEEKDGITYSLKECDGEGCIGFTQKNFQHFEKFISNINKDKKINGFVSKDFIKKVTFNWLIKTFRDQKAESNFTNYLMSEIDSAIEEIKLFFPILYLDIETPFTIGTIKFEFFTKEDFDFFANEYNKHHPDESENQYEKLRNNYQGRVFATCIVNAELEKAKEIGLQKCSIAVDILKICSDTTIIPNHRTSFDIDTKLKESQKSEILSQKVNDLKNFRINFRHTPNHHFIEKKAWQRLLMNGLKEFDNFLLHTEGKELSELENIIINGIISFSKAISNPDLHQRIVEIFSIFEFLLLKDEDQPIIESVTRYCSKLTSKSVEERKEIISLLKELYKVRSGMIHHGKRKKINNNKLTFFQITLLVLLLKLINKSKTHKTKLSLIDEIDLEILKAY